MAAINIKGPIVSDEDAWVYNFFGVANVCPSVVAKALEDADGADVDIEINSGGGSVFAGSEIYSAIRGYKGNVNIHVVGLAASAASVIMCAGHSDISPTAQVMVHNVSSCACGDYHNMDHMSETLKKANEAIASAYVAKTGMSKEDALALMDHETWLTASDAVEKGLCDEIAGSNNTNSVDFAQTLVASAGGTLPQEVINKYQAEKQNLINEIHALEMMEV